LLALEAPPLSVVFVTFLFDEFAGELPGDVAAGEVFFTVLFDLLLLDGVLAVTESVKPPANVSTHIVPYSGCGPHEIPATL